eukprot:gnl/Dysnectes_brevis/3370_a4241_764.p1 GENE.gnl/Dysnectes_brevis/3370_a4241_764~~gnl/Dysnectes_brevis/3370_a4241_764.p1  ORF type:complete len:271 (+),score=59.43 gnl/Dysnectes_brevis/3370_a4241_764:128-940(+)
MRLSLISSASQKLIKHLKILKTIFKKNWYVLFSERAIVFSLNQVLPQVPCCWATFQMDFFFTEYNVESRYQNEIGLTLDIDRIVSALEAVAADGRQVSIVLRSRRSSKESILRIKSRSSEDTMLEETPVQILKSSNIESIRTPQLPQITASAFLPSNFEILERTLNSLIPIGPTSIVQLQKESEFDRGTLVLAATGFGSSLSLRLRDLTWVEGVGEPSASVNPKLLRDALRALRGEKDVLLGVVAGVQLQLRALLDTKGTNTLVLVIRSS